MNKYKHTQSNLISNLLLPFLGFILITAFLYNNLIILIIFFIIFVIYFFSKLTVRVDNEKISINFLCSKLKKNFYFRDIKDFKIVKNKWYYGWGIRLTPHGWLVNVQGLDAIEIHFKNGKKIRIGTDDPKALLKAVKNL